MASIPTAVPELHSGDRMTQAEFHRIYERMPTDFKAELIGGIVYVASPLKRPHGMHHIRLGSALDAYADDTPGVEAADNVTVILGEEDEPQPDLYLRILPDYGGQTGDSEDEYIDGAPELVAEVAYSSRSIDLHRKREQYAASGVLEYIVHCLRPKQLRWFDLKNGEELTPDKEGVFRSAVFPGLWIDSKSLLELKRKRMMKVLQKGSASPEHAAFVARLAAAKQGP